MRFVLTVTLLIGFIGITGFGFIEMDHGGNHGMINNGCIAATVKGVGCPNGTGALDFLSFHLDAFRSFSSAVFGHNIVSLLLFLTALALLAFFDTAGSSSFRILELSALSRSRRFLEFFSPPQIAQNLTRWLALHENSPAVS